MIDLSTVFLQNYSGPNSPYSANWYAEQLDSLDQIIIINNNLLLINCKFYKEKQTETGWFGQH